MKNSKNPNPSRVFGHAERQSLLSGDSSGIRAAIQFLSWQLSRGVSERAYHDMIALEAELKAEIASRDAGIPGKPYSARALEAALQDPAIMQVYTNRNK